ncbi:MAG: helix-hairpin-helix domain-containing protein [Pirellulaceae bacterium]|nr:helix-hairpin-helix domain-containing protein [Pirellulaceae bacterium]
MRPGDQLALAGLLLLASLGAAGVWAVRGGLSGRLVDVDRAPPVEIRFQVDLNRASPPELALLPGIGETLAERIMQYRLRHGPFRELDELQRVHGIGPRTLAQLMPYLAPLDPSPREPAPAPAPASATASDPSPSDRPVPAAAAAKHEETSPRGL